MIAATRIGLAVTIAAASLALAPVATHAAKLRLAAPHAEPADSERLAHRVHYKRADAKSAATRHPAKKRAYENRAYKKYAYKSHAAKPYRPGKAWHLKRWHSSSTYGLTYLRPKPYTYIYRYQPYVYHRPYVYIRPEPRTVHRRRYWPRETWRRRYDRRPGVYYHHW